MIEVLVALAVIAFALAAVIRTAGSSVANLNYMQDKTFAHWVAMNQLAEIRLAREFPEAGHEEDGTVEMAGREWQWNSEIKDTPDPAMRRVEISVRRERDDEDSAVAALTGFLREPARNQGLGGLSTGADSGGLDR